MPCRGTRAVSVSSSSRRSLPRILSAEARGKTTSAGGFSTARRAESVRRLRRCRATEPGAVFLETTTAYPVPSGGTTAVKLREERRRPLLRAVGKAARARRCFFGNTVRRRGVRGRYDAGGAGSRDRYLSVRGSGIRGFSRAYASLADRFVSFLQALFVHIILTDFPRSARVSPRGQDAYNSP